MQIIYIYIYIFRAVHFPHVIYSQTLVVHHLNNYMSFTLFVHLYAMISSTFFFFFISKLKTYIYIYIYIYILCGGQLIPYVQIALERAGPNIQFHMYRLH